MGFSDWKSLPWVGVIGLAWIFSGCAGMEYAPKRQYLYYHKELPAADRAVEEARKAGKDKECPNAFHAAEKMKDEAYEIYWSCRTKEGIAMANEAAAKAKGLCPKKGEAAGGHAPAAKPKPAAKVIDRLTLRINFDSDKADIRKEEVPELQKAIEFVKKYPDSKIALEGYTDNVGDDGYNQKLSERRAQAVKKYLEEKGGVHTGRLTAVGKGEADPVADNATEKGRFRNRRVEVLIIGD